MVDGLLETLEADCAYRCFHFDGQTILIEDYLRIRPENRDRLLSLIRDGRIIIGPWYVMPDEFLVSGESLIKNLQRGAEICARLGVPPMKSGYVTDIFGHNSQFPQILRGFGIDSAVLYRGIGDFEKDLFTYEAPDGSSVIAAKLEPVRSYSNFYFALRWPYEKLDYSEEDFLKRARTLADYTKKRAAGGNLLFMDGVDHIDADGRIPSMIALLNGGIDDVGFVHAALEEFFEAVAAESPALDTIRGPLYNLGREGANNRLLKNVLSSAVHLKQANDRCETKLTKLAAPLEAFVYANSARLRSSALAHTMFPFKGYIDEAWTYLLKNHPHDSICGCSVTQTHLDNEYRFRQCEQIADMLVEEALEVLADNISLDLGGKDGGFVIYNPSQSGYEGIGEVLIETAGETGLDFSIFDADGNMVPYQLLDYSIFFKPIAEFNKLIDSKIPQMLRVALPLELPGYGYAAFTYSHNRNGAVNYGDYNFKEIRLPYRIGGTLRTDSNSFDNGALAVVVNANGTLSVTDKASGRTYENLLLFEDGGDLGDGWNYVRPPVDRKYTTVCSNCSFSSQSDGENAAVFNITHRLQLPADSAGIVREGDCRELEVETTVTLLKGARRINFATRVKNAVHCHRLRVLFPTRLDAEYYYSSTPFDMQEWPVKKPDNRRFTEPETNVTPNQGVIWLSDGTNSFALYNKGLYETEVTDDAGRTVALTLFRAYQNETGAVKRGLANMNMEMRFEYAADFSAATPARALIASESFKSGLLSVPASGGDSSMPARGRLFRAEGESVVSTVYAESPDCAVVRLYNPQNKNAAQTLDFGRPLKSARAIDFTGLEMSGKVSMDGSEIKVVLDPYKIVTLRIEF